MSNHRSVRNMMLWIVAMSGPWLMCRDALAQDAATAPESVISRFRTDDVTSIDVTIVRDVTKPAMSEQEVRDLTARRMQEIRDGIGSAPTPPSMVSDQDLRPLVADWADEFARMKARRIIEQRWRIAADGSFRIDQRVHAPQTDTDYTRGTYIVAPERADGVRPRYWLDRLHRRAHVYNDKSWTFEDWRGMGRPGMSPEHVKTLRLAFGGGATAGSSQGADPEIEAMSTLLRRVISDLSLESHVADGSGHVVDRIIARDQGGNATLQLDVDHNDPNVCYAVTMYHMGTPVVIRRCARFAPTGPNHLPYPREAEFVEYDLQGNQTKREALTISSVTLNPALGPEVFAFDVPNGWMVIDETESPARIYTQGADNQAGGG